MNKLLFYFLCLFPLSLFFFHITYVFVFVLQINNLFPILYLFSTLFSYHIFALYFITVSNSIPMPYSITFLLLYLYIQLLIIISVQCYVFLSWRPKSTIFVVVTFVVCSRFRFSDRTVMRTVPDKNQYILPHKMKLCPQLIFVDQVRTLTTRKRKSISFSRVSRI